VLGADVVGQVLAFGEDDDGLALGDLRDLQAQVPDEGDGLRHPLGDRVEIGHRGTLSRDRRS
jgi:hypothetical protein